MDKKRILIIDDDPGIGESLSDIFQEKGYFVSIATKGSEAITKSKQTDFNLALIDIKLPDMSGTELLKKLKEINPEIICMIITGYASVDNALDALKMGVSAYIIKPPDIDDLLNRIKEALDKQRLKEELQESEEKYRLLIETTGDIVLLHDAKGYIKFANQAAMKFTGFKKSESINRNIAEFIAEDEIPKLQERAELRHAGDTRESDYETVFINKSGNRIDIDIKGSPIFKDSKFFAELVVARDITKRKQAEERLKKTMDATLSTIYKIVEVKDPYTAGHQKRVSQLATAIAKELNLSQDKIEGIRIASLIHDIGKISVPTEILSKSTTLTDIEFSLIKTHSQTGYDILKSIDFSYPVAQIVLQHHEKINGSGYPGGLKGNEILLEAKIICVADVVEAMSSHRPYRPAKGIDAALEEISKNKGILYEPKVVDVCLKLFKEKGFKF
ncbi:MAG: PAS domain S-box protein, partial [Candidatus Caldatribacteriota bacterium]|nr:PAS domain S-box protein [Candidatus Caldatribacteriota bacterium]